MVELFEVTRAQRDAEGRANATDLDAEDDALVHSDAAADMSADDTEDEAVGGGSAEEGALPPNTGSQLELSQDSD